MTCEFFPNKIISTSQKLCLNFVCHNRDFHSGLGTRRLRLRQSAAADSGLRDDQPTPARNSSPLLLSAVSVVLLMLAVLSSLNVCRSSRWSSSAMADCGRRSKALVLPQSCFSEMDSSSFLSLPASLWPAALDRFSALDAVLSSCPIRYARDTE